jgi:hypothetical protein
VLHLIAAIFALEKEGVAQCICAICEDVGALYTAGPTLAKNIMVFIRCRTMPGSESPVKCQISSNETRLDVVSFSQYSVHALSAKQKHRERQY